MNKKTLILIVMTISMLLAVSLVNAQEPDRLTAWTDKAEYAAGDTGTLTIIFYNDGSNSVAIQSITVIFNEWRAYKNGQWEGNQTIQVNQAVVSKGVYEKAVTFTVPTNGRAKSTFAQITVQTELGTVSGGYYISVAQTPKYMDQLITIFTVQVVLIIVCTVIIAATVFLSVRRPQVMWKTEEKPQA
jgi:hypothetical protein